MIFSSFVFDFRFSCLLFLLKKRHLLFFYILFVSQVLTAQNPIVPPGMYIADPEAHVWKDGKIYVYGSLDESDAYWCSYTHHVMSSVDLIHWQIDENVFSSRGETDQVMDHDDLLFAPDCTYKNGIYYLYYCSPNKTFTAGVATSTSPYGPFSKGQTIKGVHQIDPAVLIDKDGKGYYYWGQGNAKVARLKTNMIEIDSSTTIEPLDKKGKEYFHEGSSIRKIGEKYYLIFADESRRGRPTCLGYAIGDSPMGPFEYKGVIIDNYGSDPAVWNNHGSIEKFGGQWYVFYHRSTHNSQKFRKACLEPITINPDGTIDEVEMTSQGAKKNLLANSIIQAEWSCGLEGNVRIELEKKIGNQKTNDIPNEILSKIKNGDHALFRYLSFEKALTRFTIKTSKSSGGRIEVRLGTPNGRKIAEVKIPKSEPGTPFQISEVPISSTQGKHAVYLMFKGDDDLLFDLDWFSFH